MDKSLHESDNYLSLDLNNLSENYDYAKTTELRKALKFTIENINCVSLQFEKYWKYYQTWLSYWSKSSFWTGNNNSIPFVMIKITIAMD